MTTETSLQFSQWAVWISSIVLLIGSIAVTYFTGKLDDSKNSKIDTLVKGNNELITKIDLYQKELSSKQHEIDVLKIKASKAERGLVSLWTFQGAYREGSAGTNITTLGPEFQVFQELVTLNQKHDYAALVTKATDQITKTPEWLTPYLFRGIAYANLGNIEKSISDLSYVDKTAVGDPEYADAGKKLKEVLVHNKQ